MNLFKPQPIFEVAEISIEGIRNEETAMNIVKVLASLGYDLTTNYDLSTERWDLNGSRKYIIFPVAAEVPAIHGLHIASILTELKRKDKVHIELLSSEGGSSMDIVITKQKMKET